MVNNNLTFDNCEDLLTANGILIKEKLAYFIKDYISKGNYMVKSTNNTTDIANHYVACYLFDLIAEDIVNDEKPKLRIDPTLNIKEVLEEYEK